MYITAPQTIVFRQFMVYRTYSTLLGNSIDFATSQYWHQNQSGLCTWKYALIVT